MKTKIKQAADFILSKSAKPTVALVLGSGLGKFADGLKTLQPYLIPIFLIFRLPPLKATPASLSSAKPAAKLKRLCRVAFISMKGTR